MNKRNYLATIVYDAHGADGGSDEMIPRLSEIIRATDGEVTKVENQGSHDFAYPQSKQMKSGCNSGLAVFVIIEKFYV